MESEPSVLLSFLFVYFVFKLTCVSLVICESERDVSHDWLKGFGWLAKASGTDK